MEEIDDILPTEPVTIFVIGDPHFKSKYVQLGKIFIDKVVEAIEREAPTLVICLGDILDTHEVVRVTAHKLAHDFIERISAIAPFYLLMGNHDLINASQFCTDNHIFNPYKKWKNVTIVDKPFYLGISGLDFVMCPYVPPGRFIEALDYMSTYVDQTWDMANCIFAHQEFKGCKMGPIESEIGDEWKENYPPVFTGHIHNAQKVGSNVHYVGTPYQHAYGESDDKHVWLLTFYPDDIDQIDVDAIDLGMKKKKIVECSVAELDSFDEKQLETHDIRLNLVGTPEQFKLFRKTSRYNHLVKRGLKIKYISEKDKSVKKRENTNYESILKQLVKDTGDKTMLDSLYEVELKIAGLQHHKIVEPPEPKVVYDLVFEE